MNLLPFAMCIYVFHTPHFGFTRHAVLTLGLVDCVLKTLLILKVVHTRKSSLMILDILTKNIFTEAT